MLEKTSNPIAQYRSAGLPIKQWIDMPIRTTDDAHITSAILGKSLFKFIVSIVGNKEINESTASLSLPTSRSVTGKLFDQRSLNPTQNC